MPVIIRSLEYSAWVRDECEKVKQSYVNALHIKPRSEIKKP